MKWNQFAIYDKINNRIYQLKLEFPFLNLYSTKFCFLFLVIIKKRKNMIISTMNSTVYL